VTSLTITRIAESSRLTTLLLHRFDVLRRL
jgi:hypothetical protein